MGCTDVQRQEYVHRFMQFTTAEGAEVCTALILCASYPELVMLVSCLVSGATKSAHWAAAEPVLELQKRSVVVLMLLSCLQTFCRTWAQLARCLRGRGAS